MCRCLEDTVELDIRVIGGWLPRTVFGLFTVLCSLLRMFTIALHIAWQQRSSKQKYDVIIVDQVLDPSCLDIAIDSLLTSVCVTFACSHSPPSDAHRCLRTLHMQVSSIVSFLKRYTSAQIIFYGHFPDLLLAKHSSKLRTAYRAPFNRLEASSTAAADILLVNSNFTRDTFRDTFPKLRARTDIQVLYPAVSLPSDDELQQDATTWESGAISC
jgi:hypothetical protein